MYSGWVALTGTQSIGLASVIKSDHVTSRPSTGVKPACGRSKTTTDVGFLSDISIASLTIGMYSMILLTSMPHVEVTIALGAASERRAANSFGAKPPKTTE